MDNETPDDNDLKNEDIETPDVELIEYPTWTIAVQNILERFGEVGYGCQFRHEELKEWMGIRKPQTIPQAEAAQMDYMKGVLKIRRDLLENYNIFLFPLIGHGYKVLHPENQIRKGADYYIRKSQKSLAMFARVLANVDVPQLDAEGRRIQLDKINRAAFIKVAYRKRCLPAPKSMPILPDDNQEKP